MLSKCKRRVSCYLCRCVSDIGSEASLIKSGLASTSSSIAASKRTLTSHDGVLEVPAEPEDPLPTTHVADDARSPPSYLRVSRCVGGYSTFTSYEPDRRLPLPAADDASPPPPGTNIPATTDGATALVGGGTGVSEVPKGGQQCRLTFVGDVIADVRTLSNGGGSVVNGEESHDRDSDVTDGAADGRVPDCQISSTDVKVMIRYTVTFLADRTAIRISMISYWHETVVSLSVLLSVTKCIVGYILRSEQVNSSGQQGR